MYFSWSKHSSTILLILDTELSSSFFFFHLFLLLLEHVYLRLQRPPTSSRFSESQTWILNDAVAAAWGSLNHSSPPLLFISTQWSVCLHLFAGTQVALSSLPFFYMGAPGSEVILGQVLKSQTAVLIHLAGGAWRHLKCSFLLSTSKAGHNHDGC